MSNRSVFFTTLLAIMSSTTDYSNLLNKKGEAKAVVEKHLLASQLKSGDVEVYGSPSMIGLMEEASVNAIKELLPSGQTSVGVGFNVQHLSATPLGLNVRAEAVVNEVNGRKIKLTVIALDDKEMIGEGTHERVIVDKARFIQKANGKLESKAN